MHLTFQTPQVKNHRSLWPANGFGVRLKESFCRRGGRQKNKAEPEVHALHQSENIVIKNIAGFVEQVAK
jgi:hypothetical protein